MSGGGGGGNAWKGIYVAGLAVLGVVAGLEHFGVEGGFLMALALAAGGLMTIFGACEAMILCVEALGKRLNWNEYVAGTVAGLASNVPEIVTLGFVVAKEPRVAFVVACLTLHVNALVFGTYSSLLPRDEAGHARLPKALVKLDTDLHSLAAGVFLAVGTLMLTLKAFDAGSYRGEGLGSADLFAIGAGLLTVEVVYILEMLKNFSASDDSVAADHAAKPPLGRIAGFGAVGIVGALLGGHAVGDFADVLVKSLSAAGYSEMIGGIVVSLFAGIASYLIMATAHLKGKYDIALSNVSGAVTQVPFVVLPATMILIATFAQFGIIPKLAHGGVLAIDLETTSVMLFAFPTMLILSRAIGDDGMINKLETAVMMVLFGLIVFFLAMHG